MARVALITTTIGLFYTLSAIVVIRGQQQPPPLNFPLPTFDGKPPERYPDHVRAVAVFGGSDTVDFDISAAKLFAYVDRGLIFNRTRFIVTVIRLPDTNNMLTITGHRKFPIKVTVMVDFILHFPFSF